MSFWARLLGKTEPRTVVRTVWKRSGVSSFSGGLGRIVGGGSTHYYEALRKSPDRTPITVSYHGHVNEASRRDLSAIARAIYDNGGTASYAVDQIALYSTPISVQASAPDKEWNDQAEEWWKGWSKRCDFYGRPDVDLYVIQKFASQGADLDGDAGLILTSENGFPQIQFVEGYRISSPDNPAKNVRDGVQFDAKGRVTGYWVEEVKPNGDSEHRFFPASTMFLFRDASITEPFRGVSPMRRGTNDLRDFRDILGFEKTAVKTNASMPGLIEGGGIDPVTGFDLGGSETKLAEKTEGTEQTPGTTEDEHGTPGEQKVARADLTGGDILTLPAGRKYVPVTSNRPNAQFGEFLDSLTAQFAAGLGIPPSFFLDAKMTGPGWRAIIGKAQRRFDDRQSAMCRFMEWLWPRVIGWAINAGEIPAVPGWTNVRLQRPARITIDLGDEANADREAVAKGLMPRQRYAGKRSEDWQSDADQVFAEDEYIMERAKALAARFGVPVEVVLAKWGFEPAKEKKQETK